MLKVDLKPKTKPNLIELVSRAGVDVTCWSKTARGAFANPAANPNYCYDWAFVQHGEVVVLNLWYEEIEERDGLICREMNPRVWSAECRDLDHVEPAAKSSASRRAAKMENAVAHAFECKLPVRVIVVDGPRRDYFDSGQQAASTVKMRLLDPESWWVKWYSPATGAFFIVRGVPGRYADQFSLALSQSPKQRDVQGKVWNRSPQVRESVLFRAQGHCEYCGARGFLTANGEIYLETHHVIPLSEGGPDDEGNVVAICPNDHREAHHGDQRDEIREQLLAMLFRFTNEGLIKS